MAAPDPFSAPAAGAAAPPAAGVAAHPAAGAAAPPAAGAAAPPAAGAAAPPAAGAAAHPAAGVAAPPAVGTPALLAGKVVVVCGIGPGLGRALAVRSAQAGADVVLAARSERLSKEVAAEITAMGRRAVTVATDVTDDELAAGLPAAALEAFGRVDALVNNAFAIPPLTSLGDVDLDAVRAGFETDVFGALRMTRLFTPALAASRGSVVMISSAVLRHSRLPYGPYKMAKSALLGMAQSLATELGPQGIRVNSVAPGYIWAGSLKWYFGELAKQRGVSRQQVYDETAATIDLRRLPEPDEVADAVVFLSSDLARAITGQCLDVNCGEFHH